MATLAALGDLTDRAHEAVRVRSYVCVRLHLIFCVLIGE